MLTNLLDVAGVTCLAAFAWVAWMPAAALLVVGAACLFVSWGRS